MLDYIILTIGITGVMAITLNFLLEASDNLSKDHKTFAWINFYGSIALLIYSWYNKVWLFLILNTITLLAGIYGLIIVYSQKKK